MKTFKKCEFCNVEVTSERCIFATYRLEINGKEHYFCCEQHAKKFKQEMQKSKSLAKKKTK